MSYKSIKPFVLFLVGVLCCTFMFALVACNDTSSSQDNDAPVPDHSALFKFIPNDDGQSYMARFSPNLDPDSDYNQLIPADLYIPSSYCGFPVTSFYIGNMTDLTYDKISRIKNIYIPESITGGAIHYQEFSYPYSSFCVKGYFYKNPNVVLKTYSYKDSNVVLDNKVYATLTDYLDSQGYDSLYNSVIKSYVRKGIILIPYEAE